MRFLSTISSLAFLLFSITSCSDSTNSAADGSAGQTGGAGSPGSGGSAGGSAGAAGAAGSGGSGPGPMPDPQFIPTATGACPGFADGDSCTVEGDHLRCTFAPNGIDPRDVLIWLGDSSFDVEGPLVFFWHGNGLDPESAALPLAGLGPEIIQAVTDLGGVLASPSADRSGGGFLSWVGADGLGPDDDFLVMDEVLACAIDKVGIDLRRIHSTGISAGGMQTVQATLRRSGYLASTVAFSGALLADPGMQDPNNLLPVALNHGGSGDTVIINFKDGMLSFNDVLRERGHFTYICDHSDGDTGGGGHFVAIPSAMAGWQFLKDHPYGTRPSPYESEGLPGSFPSFCEIPQ